MNTGSSFKLWSDDWWIEDAQKRVEKIKKRMRSMNPYTMSQKDYRAKIRMLYRAMKVLNEAKWLKEYHLQGEK